ncbi:MAG: ABC transporter substrate-binding protein [Gracilibacteraceae bacterium]|nr:ABC transporter substrate-binding protein [Gracilibacteraceae bacterium]
MTAAPLHEIHYTICPVGNATYLAVKKQMIHEGMQPFGITPVLLQSLAEPYWSAHFDHHDELLFREGGNIPPLWTKAKGADTLLVGICILRQKQHIIALKDAPFNSVEELRGRRIAIPAHPNSPIDFHKATAEHGFKIALQARGVTVDEVESKVIQGERTFVTNSWNHGPWSATTDDNTIDLDSVGEIHALNNGEVDAVYIKLSLLQALLETRKYKVLLDLSADPSLLMPINNEFPNVLTVSRKFAVEYPEVVVAYLKQLLLAAEWAKTNKDEAAAILAEQTYGSLDHFYGSYQSDFNEHLTINFSTESIAALEGQKRFLYDYGYLERNFPLDSWIDDSYLKAAQRDIEGGR